MDKVKANKLMKTKGLHQYSDNYYRNVAVYDQFARFEDYPNYIYDYLKVLVENKDVLDYGCGSGKYLRLLAPHAKTIAGVDASSDQIKHAQKLCRQFDNCTVKVVVGDSPKLKNNSYDATILCWVLGTIKSIDNRLTVLKAITKSLKPGGKIILVENAWGSEFESIRGRVDDPLNRTRNYNKWLQHTMGFVKDDECKTYFKFSDLKTAQAIFGDIWGYKVQSRINSSIIQHKVCYYTHTRESLSKRLQNNQKR